MRGIRGLVRIASLGCANISPVFAQWVLTDGYDPHHIGAFANSPFYCFALDGTYLFTGLTDGVYLSNDEGHYWTYPDSSSHLPFSHTITALMVQGTTLYAGTDAEGIFLSDDNGLTWIASDTGFLSHAYFHAFALAGGTVYAASDSGILLSTNSGASWSGVDSGLTTMEVHALAFCDTVLFAGSWGGGVFMSKNNGTSWTAVDSGLTGRYVNALAVSGTNLFVGTSSGVFHSANSGTSWAAVDSGLTSTYVITLAVSDTDVFAGTNAGVYLSTNNGATWSGVSAGLPVSPSPPADTLVHSLLAGSKYLFAGSYYGGIWRRPLSEMITSVKQRGGIIPSSVVLFQNYPNPFNPTTTISYQLSSVGQVTLKIYDVLGREVGTLVNTVQNPGRYDVKFDGSHLASGVYLQPDCSRH